MSGKTLDDVLQAMDLMVEAETLVCTFYKYCAEAFFDEHDFWNRLAQEEENHSKVLRKLYEIIRRNPEEFAVGKVSPRSALLGFMSRVSEDTEKLRSGRLNARDALSVAYHIESTVIEHKYTEVIVTENEKYLTALSNLMHAEVKHKDRIVKRMKEAKHS
jgi:rubrerythrin